MRRHGNHVCSKQEAHLYKSASVGMHVFAAAKDAVDHDCSRGRALAHLLLTPPYQGPLYQLVSLQMVQPSWHGSTVAIQNDWQVS